MNVKILTIIILIFFLSGCATTKKNTSIEIQQLKGRVASLETDLQTKEREVMRLEDELEKTYEKRTVLKEEKGKEIKQIELNKLSIIQIQSALKNAGFYKGAVDDKMGPTTTEAIKAFQRASGLKADGVVGKKTRSKLMGYLTDSSKNRVK